MSRLEAVEAAIAALEGAESALSGLRFCGGLVDADAGWHLERVRAALADMQDARVRMVEQLAQEEGAANVSR